MTEEQLLTHLDEMEQALIGGAGFLTTQAFRLLDSPTRHIHANTLVHQIAYHAMLLDQLQLRFPQHKPQEIVK